jgi:hypothetical protein
MYPMQKEQDLIFESPGTKDVKTDDIWLHTPE